MTTNLLIPAKFDRWIKRGELSLTFAPDTPDEVFDEAFQALLHAHARVQFYIGDAINFSERYQHGRYKRFLSGTGYSQKSLYNMAWVASSVPPECRRADLPYGFHKLVSSVPAEAQTQLLALAAENQWSVRQLEVHVRSHKGTLPPLHFGDPMNFRGLRHAPINELGVVFLFGIISGELGFVVESVHSAFPDCSAKRLVDAKKKRWVQVSIEFEFFSRNFLLHGHSISGCDLIVCWEHDWNECPIEVIVLQDEIKKLQDHPGQA